MTILGSYKTYVHANLPNNVEFLHIKLKKWHNIIEKTKVVIIKKRLFYQEFICYFIIQIKKYYDHVLSAKPRYRDNYCREILAIIIFRGEILAKNNYRGDSLTNLTLLDSVKSEFFQLFAEICN